MQKITRFLGSPAGLVLRFVVSLGLIAVLALKVDWSQLAAVSDRLAVGPAVAGLVLALLAYPLCAWRWHLLLRGTGVTLAFGHAHTVTWIGQFYNAFLPGGIGGDATRLWYAFHDHPQQKAAATTATVLDRAIGFAVLVVLAALALLLAGRTAPEGQGGKLAWLLGAIAAGLALAAWIAAAVVLPRLPPAWSAATARLRAAPGALVGATLLSALVWLLDFASGWCLALSLGLELNPVALSAALGLAYLSTLLPLSLGGHGLREGSLVLALHWLGQADARGADGFAAFALLFLTVSLATSLVGGLFLLVVRRRDPSKPPGR
jgi:hypothetical protein